MLRIRKTIPAAITRLTRNTVPTVSACRSVCLFIPAAAFGVDPAGGGALWPGDV